MSSAKGKQRLFVRSLMPEFDDMEVSLSERPFWKQIPNLMTICDCDVKILLNVHAFQILAKCLPWTTDEFTKPILLLTDCVLRLLFDKIGLQPWTDSGLYILTLWFIMILSHTPTSWSIFHDIIIALPM